MEKSIGQKVLSRFRSSSLWQADHNDLVSSGTFCHYRFNIRGALCVLLSLASYSVFCSQLCDLFVLHLQTFLEWDSLAMTIYAWEPHVCVTAHLDYLKERCRGWLKMHSHLPISFKLPILPLKPDPYLPHTWCHVGYQVYERSMNGFLKMALQARWGGLKGRVWFADQMLPILGPQPPMHAQK